VHPTLWGVVFSLDFDPFFFLLLFPRSVFFLYLFIYIIWVEAHMWEHSQNLALNSPSPSPLGPLFGELPHPETLTLHINTPM
jgi:hypothetical protein